jgi:hypothetical protein
MPFIKISQLTTATAVSATNQFEINQNGASRSAEVSVVAAYVRSSATNVLMLPAGSAAAPALFPTGDTNTGIFFPAADTIAFTEGGVESMRLDASGNLGIGVAPGGVRVNVSVNSTSDAVRITQTGTGNALVVEDSANPDATPFVVDAGGNVISGHTATIAVPNYAGNSQQTLGVYRIATGTPQSSYGSFLFNSSSTQSPQLIFARSAGPTIGDFTLAPSGAVLGAIAFNGSDGTDFATAANITAVVDGTSGPDDMPGRLVFSTTADGAASPTERMRIDNLGRVSSGSGGPIGNSAISLRANLAGYGQTTNYGVRVANTFDSAATAAILGYSLTSWVGGVGASPYTTTNVTGYDASPFILGSNQTVTNLFGFSTASGLTVANNNYGFYANIPTLAPRTITTVQRASNVATITTSTTHNLSAGMTVTVAATTNTSFNGTFIVTSVPTTTTYTYAQVAADLGPTADTGTSTVAGRWNFYANGSAPNFFAGPTTISVSSADAALRITQVGAGNALLVEDSASPDATPFVVDAGGQLTVGSLTRSALGAVTPNILVQNNTSGTANGIGVASWLASAAGSKIALGKSRSTTIGTNSIVSNGDALATISFSGDDGAAFVDAASITAAVDGTPGTNDMPGRLVFSTTADGAASPTERMRITQAGNVGIGVSSPVNRLQVNGSFGRGAPVTKTADFTLADTENWIICNGTGSITVTFPTASSWTGREVMIKTIAAQTVISASSNVVPVDGSAAGTAILAATAGKWATLVSDGTNWIIMAAA